MGWVGETRQKAAHHTRRSRGEFEKEIKIKEASVTKFRRQWSRKSKVRNWCIIKEYNFETKLSRYDNTAR